jgi:RNA polymerase sigma-70 factor (ECF subfamily)
VDESPDSKLIVALQGGDNHAFERLVREYSPRMLATARRLLSDETEAQDCVQEAFLSAFRAIGQFEHKAALATWLHRITINAVLQKLRKEQRQREESIEPLLPQFDQNGRREEPCWGFSQSVEQIIEQQNLRELVTAKIAELPDQYRIVLVLRDVEGLDTREVAGALGVSESVVKTRLHRARSALKTLLHPLWKEIRQ